jgi:curli biogenesis system outer membrane secretion channel CsgG
MVMIIALALLFCQLGLTAMAQRKGDNRDTTAAPTAPVAKSKNGKASIIAVASATSNTQWTMPITESELENALVQTGRFTVLSRSSLDAILKEQKLAQSDLADPTKATEIGKLLSAQYIVIGKCVSAEKKEGGFSVGGFNNKKKGINFVGQFQLLDVETGAIIDSLPFNDKAEASSSSYNGVGGNSADVSQEEAYRTVAKQYSSQFMNKITQLIPIIASVVLVKGNEVAIDAGTNASVKQGLEFDVFTDGEPIKNAAGEVLAYDRTVHGKIRIARVEDKLSWATIVQTFGDNGQPDASPNPARIQRDFTVKQTGMSPVSSTPASTPTADPKKDDKKNKDGLKGKLHL